MNNKKLIWLIVGITIMITFLFLIPNSIYNLSPFIFSILGTALTLLCVFQAVYNFKNIQEYRDKVNKGNDTKFKILNFSSIPFAFILFMTFWINFYFDKSSEIDKHGINTKATIISANVTNVRRKTGTGKIHYAKVKFVTENGKIIIAEERITEEQYKNITIGQEIGLNYSKKDPNIVKLIIESEEEPEDLKISQLINLLNTHKDSVDFKLMSFNPMLKQVDENSWKDKYSNVMIEDSTMISAIIRGDLMDNYYFELKQLGFDKVNIESSQELFESKNYKTILNKRTEGIFVFTAVTVARK